MQTELHDNGFRHLKKVRFYEQTADDEEKDSFDSKPSSHPYSIEKIKIPRSLILHKKHKSSDLAHITKLEVPSVNEMLARIFSSSSSPKKQRTESRIDDLMICIPKVFKSYSPSKAGKSTRTKQTLNKKHIRSMSPLKPFHDRIIHLKRLIGK